MPGYRLANPDKEKIDAKYFCSYCQLLLREAMQTSCGHFYCQSCLGNLIQDQLSVIMVCLVDQKHLQKNEVFPDNFMRREVFALVVFCTFMEDGCNWKGEVRNLEAHTNSCEFLKLPCVHPECGVLVKKADLPEHLENECLYRLVGCPLCHANVVFIRMTQHQENECPAYPVLCDKCNKEGIPRGKFSDGVVSYRFKARSRTTESEKVWQQIADKLNSDHTLKFPSKKFGFFLEKLE